MSSEGAVVAGEAGDSSEPARIIDARAVRVALGPASAQLGTEPMVVEPPRNAQDGLVLVDDRPIQLRLQRLDPAHGLLVEGSGEDETRSSVVLLPMAPAAGPDSGVSRREVIVDGWRIEVEIESARRAELRDRARRGRAQTARGGSTEVRATIPGRVVALSVAPGDRVVAGQPLLVVEAMKMQNELRAPRDGVVAQVAVGAGRTIEHGDLLLVLE